ncbi:MAG: Lrp/AsnC ligand binding domain-containing protein [Nitrosopumilus sp.]|uniref:Lrp/AsnC ligand binding domain-containing protein n=1 Tax=Nitrosopumilus sp. TaxID=2024843 RepID=UPI0024705193|nr:Lrp/AsnC ligand binding domain-containing protein [Nitrosopumilus sp.]MDH5432168.1 Lrp/AsnC ligand binding domain-containing protein [Nitrosopumilus sp.]
MKKAFVLIGCDLGKKEDILIALRTTNQIKEDHSTRGAYDIVTEVNSNDAESLRKTINCKIRKLPSIRSSLCLMAIEEQH